MMTQKVEIVNPLNFLVMKDTSEITQNELVRYGIDKMDNDTVIRFKLLLDKRIELRDSDYTTMSDAEWIKHFRKSLVTLLDNRDAENTKTLS
jgi:hypothetical protein